MAKKINKKETNSEVKIDSRNVESIIKGIKDKLSYVETANKYDGITIEFKLYDETKSVEAKNQVEMVCKEYKLIPYSIEQHKLDNKKFIVQFPEMVPEYTNDEIEKMYIDSFKWLLADVVGNKSDVTKEYIIKNIDKFINMAIKIYIRSNANQYKEDTKTKLNDIEYRKNLKALFLNCLEDYWNNRGK